jgi:hypothetical protein
MVKSASKPNDEEGLDIKGMAMLGMDIPFGALVA